MKNNLFKKHKKAILLLLFLCVLILIPSFLLLMGSSWSNDDYLLAKLFQLFGLDGLSYRVLKASPRFWSETLLYIYYNLVGILKKPFTGLFLLSLWLGLILSLFISFKSIIYKFSKNIINPETEPNTDKNIFLITLLLSLILFCYFIYAEEPMTMYYVPAVSAPYLLTLSGIILNINFFLTKADNLKISWQEFITFTVISIMIATSWEIGAVYQLIFNICFLLILFLTSFKPDVNYLPFSLINRLSKIKLSIGIFVSSALSIYVILLIKIYRVGFMELNSSLESASMGSWKNSFTATLNRFGNEILFINHPGWQNSNSWHSFSYSIVLKLGLLLLIFLILLRLEINLSKRVQNACFVCLIPLLMTNFITIITSYYQFGEVCCPRQLSFRATLFGLSIFLISLLLSSKINYIFNNHLKDLENKKQNNLYIFFKKVLLHNFSLIIIFCLTFTLLVNLQFNYLKRDLVNLNKIIDTNNINWEESQDKNNNYAIHRQIPTSYIYRFNLEEGIYPSCISSQNILATFYMDYFDKEEFYVLPVDKDISYLSNNSNYNNRYITSINDSNNIRFICRYSRGWVDKINNSSQTSSIINVKKGQLVELEGWAVMPDNTKANSVMITMGNDNMIVTKTPVDQIKTSVAESFRNPNLLNSGWIASFTPPFPEEENPIIFRAWAYDEETKSAYLFREFYLQFNE